MVKTWSKHGQIGPTSGKSRLFQHKTNGCALSLDRLRPGFGLGSQREPILHNFRRLDDGLTIIDGQHMVILGQNRLKIDLFSIKPMVAP